MRRLPFDVPDHGGGSLADVLPAALTALGLVEKGPGPDLPSSSRVVVVLVDGLGMAALLAHAQEAPYLTSLLEGEWSRRLTTVFPSTTPIALTSLGTGLPPAQHGLTGLYLRLREPTGARVINTLAIPAETDMRALQPQPTVFERVSAEIAVTRVGPASFDGQGLTEAALRGGDYAAAETPVERVAATATAVRRGDKSLTYVYWGDLDSVGHRKGCETEEWRAELTRVDRWVEHLVAALPPGTTMLLTSDHGMLDVPAGNRFDVGVTDALQAGVEVVTGDLRGSQVHVRPGATDDVLASWRETLGEAYWVVPRDDAVDLGLYGPFMPDAFRARLGDVLALAVTDHVVLDSRTMPARFLSLVGMHGGLTDVELGIPLLVTVAGD